MASSSGRTPTGGADLDADTADHAAPDDADVAVAIVLERFYKRLFLGAVVCVAGACLWALWREWVNPWHSEHLGSTVIALLLLAGAGVAAWRSDRLYEILRRQPAWSFVPATIVMVAVWVDGTQGSQLFIVSLLTIAPIAVATDARWTVAVAGYLTVGYVVGLMGVNSITWAHLDAIDDADTQLEHIFAYLPVSLLFIYPLERGASYVARSNQIINDERSRLQSQLRRARLEARSTKLAAAAPPGAATSSASEVMFAPDRRRLTDELSAREVQIGQLVAEGLSNNEIAERMYLSPRTVQSHVANAMMKTHANSRTQLAVLMIRDGLVSGEHPSSDSESAA